MRLSDLEACEYTDELGLMRLRRVGVGRWTAEWREHVTDPWTLLPGVATTHIGAYWLAVRVLDIQPDNDEDDVLPECGDAF